MEHKVTTDANKYAMVMEHIHISCKSELTQDSL